MTIAFAPAKSSRHEKERHNPASSQPQSQGSRFVNLLFAQAPSSVGTEILAELPSGKTVTHLEQYYGYYRRALRDALTRPSREPFQYGGLQGYEQLVGINQALLARRARWGEDPYLDGLQRRVQSAVKATEPQAQDVRQAKDCLVDVERCLVQMLPPSPTEPQANPSDTMPAKPKTPSPPRSQVAKQKLEQTFEDWARRTDLGATTRRTLAKAKRMAKDWLPGILHCYDLPDLPRHNLRLESLFGTLRRDERRVSGRRETSPLRAFGPGKLMFMSLQEEEVLPWLQSVPVEAYWTQRRLQEEREEPRRWLRRLRRDPVKALAQVDRQFYAVVNEQARVSPGTL